MLEKCYHCEEELPSEKAYLFIHRPTKGEPQYYTGHKYCLMALEYQLKEKAKTKRILVHPAAFNKEDPLYIGYVGKEKEVKTLHE